MVKECRQLIAGAELGANRDGRDDDIRAVARVLANGGRNAISEVIVAVVDSICVSSIQVDIGMTWKMRAAMRSSR